MRQRRRAMSRSRGRARRSSASRRPLSSPRLRRRSAPGGRTTARDVRCRACRADPRGRAPLGASDVDFLRTAPTADERGAGAGPRSTTPTSTTRRSWQGAARETGALARMAGHPLVADAAIARLGRGVGARLVARLVEIGRGAGRPAAAATARSPSATPPPSRWVETARGLLVHRVRARRRADRRLSHRRAHGVELSSARAPSRTGRSRWPLDDAARLESDVRWIVASLDPCVGVRYEAQHA